MDRLENFKLTITKDNDEYSIIYKYKNKSNSWIDSELDPMIILNRLRIVTIEYKKHKHRQKRNYKEI